MDTDTTTSRKGFFKQASLGLAGALALTGMIKGTAKPKKTATVASKSNDIVAPRSALSRVRPAQGTVARSSTL